MLSEGGLGPGVLLGKTHTGGCPLHLAVFYIPRYMWSCGWVLVLRMGAVGLLGGYEPAAGPSRCFVRSIKSRLTGLDPGCRRFGPGRAIMPNSQGERF